MRKILSLSLLSCPLLFVPAASAQKQDSATISDTSFLKNGAPFYYTGSGFFDALYNPASNKSTQERDQWLDKFQEGYGHPSISPTGIPDPEHNPYHRQVLEFVSMQERYRPETKGQEMVE